MVYFTKGNKIYGKHIPLRLMIGRHCGIYSTVGTIGASVIVSIVGAIGTMDVVILLNYSYILYNISNKSMFYILPYQYIIVH